MPMLSEYRHFMAMECGPYVGPPLFDPVAYGGSDLNKVISLMYPIQSGIPQDDVYTDRPLYRPYALRAYDKNRYVMSYDPPTGTLNVDLAWQLPMIGAMTGNTYFFLESFTYGQLQNDPVGFSYADLEGFTSTGPGEHFELLGPFDAPTMHELINEGLRMTWVTVDVACIPTPGSSYHDLSGAAPWLQDANHVRQVGVLAQGEQRVSTDPFQRVVRGKVVRDGGVFYLDTGSRTFNSTDVLYLRCYKQAYYHCRVDSLHAFGTQTGLQFETDEAPVNTEWVAAAAIMIGWRRFGHILELASNQRLIRDQQQSTVWFNDQARKHFQAVKPMLTFTEARAWGPPRALAG